MNGLSWIIYGAGVAGGVKVILELVSAFSALGVLAALAAIYGPADWRSDTLEEKIRKKSQRASGAKWLKRLPIISLAFALSSVLIPNKESIYLIGASQAGEQIIALQEVQDIGGEVGALASDTIRLLRSMASDQIDK